MESMRKVEKVVFPQEMEIAAHDFVLRLTTENVPPNETIGLIHVDSIEETPDGRLFVSWREFVPSGMERRSCSIHPPRGTVVTYPSGAFCREKGEG